MKNKKLFIGCYNPSIILTYISVFCSVIGIGHLMMWDPSDTFNYMKIALPLLIIAGICDMFDGTVARMCKRTDKEKEFGIQLDSLADTVSFVVFPACILLHMVNFSILSKIIACFYVFAGIMRLGWFNVMVEENKGFFQGLPVTMASLIIPVVYIILKSIAVPYNIFSAIVQIVFSLIGLLFILNFKLQKPNTKTRVVLVVVAFVIGIVVFLV